MSLEHLYHDLNELGVYPDLIDGKKKGKGNVRTNGITYSNRYYGFRYLVYGYSWEVFRYNEDPDRIYYEILNGNDQEIKYHGDKYLIWLDKDVYEYFLTYNDKKKYIMRKVNICFPFEMFRYILKHRRQLTGPKALVSMIKKYTKLHES